MPALVSFRAAARRVIRRPYLAALSIDRNEEAASPWVAQNARRSRRGAPPRLFPKGLRRGGIDRMKGSAGGTAGFPASVGRRAPAVWAVHGVGAALPPLPRATITATVALRAPTRPGPPSRGRRMKIHEYQAKELLAAAGAAVPRGIVVSIAGRGAAGVRQARRRRSSSRPRSTPAAAARARFKGSGKDFGGVKFVDQARRRRPGRRGHVQVSAGHQADRRGRAEGLEGAGAGGGRHRPRDLRRHGAGPRHRPAGADGLRRGRRRDRGSRRQAPRRRSSRRRSIPTRACNRSRPGGWPTSWASPASRSPKAETIMTALAKVFLDKDCSLAEINPLVVTPTGEVHGAGRQDDVRRQRPVPPPGHREAARRDARRTRPSCGRPSRA